MIAARGLAGEDPAHEHDTLFSDGEEMHFSAELGREAARLERLERRLASHLGRASTKENNPAATARAGKGARTSPPSTRRPLARENGQERCREGGVNAANGATAAAAAGSRGGPAATPPQAPRPPQEQLRREPREESQVTSPGPLVALLGAGGRDEPQHPHQDAPPTLLRYPMGPRLEAAGCAQEGQEKAKEGGKGGGEVVAASGSDETGKGERDKERANEWESEREELKRQVKETKGALEEALKRESVRRSEGKKAAAKAERAVGEMAELTASLKAERKAVSELHMRLREAEQLRTVSEVELRTARAEIERLQQAQRAAQGDAQALREDNMRLEVQARTSAETERNRLKQQLEQSAARAEEQDQSIRRLTSALILAERDVQEARARAGRDPPSGGSESRDRSLAEVSGATEAPRRPSASVGAPPPSFSLEDKIATLLGDGLLDD